MPPKQPVRRINSLPRDGSRAPELQRSSTRDAGNGIPLAGAKDGVGTRGSDAVDLHSAAAGTLAMAAARPPVTAPERKKAATTKRKVLKLDTEGRTSMLEANKVAITHQLGVHSRDLRLLDPHLATSYPSAILCRDQALVVNMEQVKCIITRHYLLLLNPEDDAVLPFVQELQKKLGPKGEPAPSEVGSLAVSELTMTSMSEMPFELRALEVVLDTVSTQMERQASDLEAAAHPALDALTAKVTTHHLERVRRIKNRLVRLTTRVETLREVLEKFLNDDNDMKDMNLTAKYEQHVAQLQRRSLDMGTESRPSPLLGGQGAPAPFKAWEERDDDSDSDVDEVEYMLETYFMQMDNTHNKLQTLMEYIDDTEDYINIELDSHRNQIIQLDLVLTTATASAAFVGAIGSIFGMNLANNPDGSVDDTYTRFVLVSALATGGAFLFFCSVVAYLYHRRLIGFR